MLKENQVHTLISGRGRYVLIHADEPGSPKRVESFVVGMDFAAGEKSVWVVEGGKYKASFLLEGAEGERLLISEVSLISVYYSSSCCCFRVGKGGCGEKLTLDV